MSSSIRILAFAGSARRESWNHRLVSVAADGARQAGAEVTLLDMRDYVIPLFDEDCESERGMPAPAAAFKEQLVSHHGFLIACPEYNSSITPLLKNAIDWASRAAPGEAPLIAFRGKLATLVSASPGALGGLRGLATVRSILGNIGVLVLPGQVAVGRAHEAFESDGRLKDARQHKDCLALGSELADMARRLTRPA